MWWVSAEMRCGLSGSNTTMSASEPTAMVPFCGKSPNIFAGVVAVDLDEPVEAQVAEGDGTVVDQLHPVLHRR